MFRFIIAIAISIICSSSCGQIVDGGSCSYQTIQKKGALVPLDTAITSVNYIQFRAEGDSTIWCIYESELSDSLSIASLARTDAICQVRYDSILVGSCVPLILKEFWLLPQKKE